MGYAFDLHEDVASSLTFKEGAADDFLKFETKKFYLHGPSSRACRYHSMPAMLMYQEGGVSRSLFMDAPQALAFLQATDAIRRTLSMMPLVLSFKMILDGTDQTFVLDRSELKAFWGDLDRLRAPLNDYIRENGCRSYSETPVREGSPSEKTLEKRRQPYGLKHGEPGSINLENLDEGVLLALLYNNAQAYGSNFKAYRGTEMTPSEGRHIFSEMDRLGMPAYFDDMNGRPIKCCFVRDDKKRWLSVSNYWGFNGVPVAGLVPLAKRGIYEYLSDSAYRSYKREVTSHCELLISMSSSLGLTPRGDDVVEAVDKITRSALSPQTISGWQRDQEESYPEALKPENCGHEYQLSLFNASPSEVGYMLEPFTRRHAMRLVKRQDGMTLG